MAEDISYSNGHQRFRYRAAAIIIEEGAICFMSSPTEDYHYSSSIRRNGRRSYPSRSCRSNGTTV